MIRCNGTNCPVKDLCKRATLIGIEKEPRYFDEIPLNADLTCDKFIGIDNVSTEVKEEVYEQDLGLLSKDELDEMLEPLFKYGLVFWHQSKTNSYYYKFRDARLGSIRISNHKARPHMKYTYMFPHNAVKQAVRFISAETEKRASNIQYFDPNQFVAYNKDRSSNKKYIRFFSENEWRAYIKKGR